MNKRGFAISIILYSLVFILIMTFYIILGIVKARYTVTNALKETIMDDLNSEYNVGVGEELVREAIAKKTSCNPIFVDNMGTSNDETDDITYLSGTNECIDFNYVWYSGKLWRIVAIYPDGAMKLVTENSITSMSYNASGQVNFYTNANTTSYMYQWLNEDFYDTLYNPATFLDTTKEWNATMQSENDPKIKPAETTIVTANVGLLNSYEYSTSYRNSVVGSRGYLDIGYDWWLLNPYNASGLWVGTHEGGYSNSIAPTMGAGVRPSIIIQPGTEFIGNGTTKSPYRLVGDKAIGKPNELINTRLSGEYVKLQNGNKEQLFRIIGVEDNKTKIIAMDYANDNMTKKFSTSTGTENILWGSGATTAAGTWYTYLNSTYYPNLVNTYGSLFDSGTYYLGITASTYKLSICANTTSGNTKVCDKASDVGAFNIGLPRYGEMFATHQAGGYSNSISIWLWLITRVNSSSQVWCIDNRGGIKSGTIPNAMHEARPTVHLKSTVKIKSGKGTEKNPYVVGL